MAQRVEEQIGAIPAVEAEGHLVQVGLQMLGADLVPRSHDAALEQRESRLNGVGMNVGSEAHILFSRVIHRLMLDAADCFLICGQLISDDHINVRAYVLLDVPRQRACLSILSMKEPQIAVALPNPDDYFFRVTLSAPAASITALLSAEIGRASLRER